ncbi:TIGR02757 family protein [Sulfurospirillum arcachonense]|uniref:TIGR02757 family protein n=1 Tax=Sulfurospirillum arcachonense TaxID=57666 RepID=UPI000468244D|nr:TIGR02757 family protein [Sulfurospirillum arcachonense]
MNKVYELLEKEIIKRNSHFELNEDKPDPLLIASIYKDEYISLICALFAYGNVQSIMKFLKSLDFSLLEKNNTILEKSLEKSYYRFQSNQDVIEFFKTMKLLKQSTSLESQFYEGYKKKFDVMEGLSFIISYMYDLNSYRSRGYEFLIGKIPTCKNNSPYKRWHMYLRWMVRKDNLDLGLWTSIDKKDLLMPLDTHTFNIGQKLGLIKRKSYDFKAVLELTEALRKFDINDPVKYDFALYRIGQEKMLEKNKA